jgi:hypothetical protein
MQKMHRQVCQGKYTMLIDFTPIGSKYSKAMNITVKHEKTGNIASMKLITIKRP